MCICFIISINWTLIIIKFCFVLFIHSWAISFPVCLNIKHGCQANVTWRNTVHYLRDGVNACWCQIRQLAVWHVMQQALSGTWTLEASRAWRNVAQRTGVTGIWSIDTAVWRNVCLHTKRAVFCVRKCDKLRQLTKCWWWMWTTFGWNFT